MKLTADQSTGNYIQSLENAAVLVQGTRYSGAVVVSADRVLPEWTQQPLEALAESDFLPVFELDPEVIILGTGAGHRFVDQRLATAIMNRGIGFETMATSAACRTYNILLAEDRRVAAALFVE